MKNLFISLFAALFFVSCNTSRPTVEWIEGALDPETGLYKNEFVVRGVPADAKDWVVWFWSQTMTHFEEVESDGLEVKRFNASVHMLSPKGTPKVAGEYRVRYRTSAKMWNQSKFPGRFSFRNGTDKPMLIDVTYKMLPLLSDGEQIYATNDVAISESAPEHIIPCLKQITYSAEGTTDLSNWERATAEVKMLNEKHPEGWYRITLDGGVKIEAADEFGDWATSIVDGMLHHNAATTNSTRHS